MVLPEQTELIKTLKRSRVAFAALFGSRAKGAEVPVSDYDFLIEFEPDAKYTLFDLVEVKENLQEILRSPVDVITMGGLSALVRYT